METPSFIIVDKIKFPPAPESQITTIELPMRSGAIPINKKYGVRKIEIDLTIVASNRDGVLKLGDSFTNFFQYDEPQPIVLRDLPDRKYYAMLDGSCDLEKIEEFGKGTVTLTCYDPHGYGLPREYNLAPQNTSPIIYDNQGNHETYPKISMVFTKNLTDFAIATSDDYLAFGDFDNENDVAADLSPLYINDTGASTSGWTQGVTIDGGVPQNTLSSNGYTFQQAGKDYGSGTQWHGGTLIKSLGKTVKDFECEAQVGLISATKEEIGRVELYLLGVNGEKLGKIAMKDYYSTIDSPMFDAWVGAVGNGGISVINSYGAYKGVWRSFNGVIRIGRKGKVWSFYAAQVDPVTYKHHTRMYKEFTDWKGTFAKDVAAIQIHIGALKTHKPVNNMFISNVKFKELKTASGNQKDYVFKTGDRLDIDCDEMKVYKNGESYAHELLAGSSFPVFKKGTNGLSVSDPSFKEGKISYIERWV